MQDAAIIIIGNEILTGKFPDENAPFLLMRLRSIGIDVKRMVTLPDEIEEIAREVRYCSERYSYVFTTGGVGPTHDDLTVPAIAHAFGVPLERLPVLEAIVLKKLGENVQSVALRMAEVPQGAELWWDGDMAYPQVVMRNVIILPGVPRLVQRKFDAMAYRFTGVPVQTARFWTLATEPEIADVLTAASQQWPSVAIGSYPRFEERPVRVIVTLEGRVSADLQACLGFLMAQAPGAQP